jgi:hypothetical protein
MDISKVELLLKDKAPHLRIYAQYDKWGECKVTIYSGVSRANKDRPMFEAKAPSLLEALVKINIDIVEEERSRKERTIYENHNQNNG